MKYTIYTSNWLEITPEDHNEKNKVRGNKLLKKTSDYFPVALIYALDGLYAFFILFLLFLELLK